MKQFNLFEDCKIKLWRRYYYTVSAESLEDAIEQIKEGVVSPYDEGDYDGSGCPILPEENEGEATNEIYSLDTDQLIYSNKIK